MTLPERYGSWALIAGASVGLGAAIADGYVSRGENVVILARRARSSRRLLSASGRRRGVEVRTIVADLQADDIWERIAPVIDDIDLGMFVYNACQGFRRQFLDDSLATHFSGLAINCRTPAVLTWHIGRMMREKGRGSIVICCSMGGMGGQFGRATTRRARLTSGCCAKGCGSSFATSASMWSGTWSVPLRRPRCWLRCHRRTTPKCASGCASSPRSNARRVCSTCSTRGPWRSRVRNTKRCTSLARRHLVASGSSRR